MLLGQSEARRDPPINAEHLSNELGAIAFPAAMQKHDVIRRLARAVEEFANGGESLRVGQMAVATGNPSLDEMRTGTVGLHLRVVVGFQCDAIEIAEAIEEVRRHVAEVGGVANAIAEAVDDEAVRAKSIMSERDWIASQSVNRRECFTGEWSDERHELRGAESKGTDLIGMTIDWDIKAAECRGPPGRKVVAIEVGEADRADVSQPDAGAAETFGECARTDAGVDKQDAGRRPDDRRISGRAAGKDAKFERHRARYLNRRVKR